MSTQAAAQHEELSVAPISVAHGAWANGCCTTPSFMGGETMSTQAAAQHEQAGRVAEGRS